MSDPIRVLSGLAVISVVAGIGLHREQQWQLRADEWNRTAHAAATEQTSPDNPKGSLLETQEAASKEATELTGKVQLLEAENRDLRDQLTKAVEAAKPPPSPDELAISLAAQRELPFRQLPAWAPVPLDDVLARIRSLIEKELTESAAAARARAAVAMGWHSDRFDYREGLISLAQMQPGGIYDPDENRLYYQAEASLARADGREAFIGGLTPALLRQNFRLADRNWLETDNDDAALAAQSLIHGDANATRVRFSISDQANLNFDRNGAPVAPPPTYDAPVYLAETWKFTHDKGSQFIEALQAKGGSPAVNAAWSRPPRSTAEVIHPELYFASPPFVPVEITLPVDPVGGIAPLHVNTAGELGIYITLRAFCDMDLSATAAAGWIGDRYAVYPGDEEYGDSVYWKTVWATPEDATAFHQAMRRILMQRYSIPWQKSYDVSPDNFSITDPHRVLRVIRQPDGITVTVINTAAASFAAALETAAAAW